MANISHFDCDVLSSNLSLVTINVGFRLTGKASVCATEDQGSNPKADHKASGRWFKFFEILIEHQRPDA